MVASGFAGLGYQIIWTQQAALWLGHEAAAVPAVVTAFFGGLALGAWVLGSRIEKSARPNRACAVCEVVIALWSGVLALALSPVSGWVLDATFALPSPLWQWTVGFAATFWLLLPATAAMGATLPAMARVLASLQTRRLIRPQEAGTATASTEPVAPAVAAPLAALYACNTLGAMLGVLTTAFWLVPAIGLARTAAVCAALNLFCAAAVLGLVKRHAGVKPAAATSTSTSTSTPATGNLAVLAATGLLGIGYEVLVVRVLSQVTEATVYRRWPPPTPQPHRRCCEN